MPRGDGTGPIGAGCITGRGLGNCIKFGVPVIAGIVACLRLSRRRGSVKNYNSNFSDLDELSILKNQSDALENALKEVKERILKLEQQ